MQIRNHGLGVRERSFELTLILYKLDNISAFTGSREICPYEWSSGDFQPIERALANFATRLEECIEFRRDIHLG
jgi:hypothetical protein